MQKDQYRIMFALEDKHWWFLAKREFIKAVLPKATGKMNILDIGCGTGGLSLYLTKWGQVTGIENEAEAYPFLKSRKIKYLAAPVELCRFAPGSFDLICLFDVLYHKKITNDQKVLKKVFNWLKPGGLLCLTDSAGPMLYSNHDKIMQARKRYTLSEMEAKVKKAGFKIIRKSHIFFLVFPLFVISRLINKVIDFSTVNKINSRLNQILLTVCKYEAKLIKFWQMPFGSSIIILAEK